MNYFSNLSNDPVSAFADALRDAGFRLDGPPIMDGVWRRCAVEGDKGRTQSGSYRGFLDSNPAGGMTNFKDESRSGKWCFKADMPVQSGAEREAARHVMDAARAAREAEEAEKQAEAARVSRAAWDCAAPAPATHSYLLRKGISANGLRVRLNKLLVPMLDFSGEVQGVQTIYNDGTKRFPKNGTTKNLHCLLGNVEDGGWLLICEGYATGATLHAATGLPVAVAFDKSNYASIASEYQGRADRLRVAFAGDNDHQHPRRDPPLPNVGKEAAERAARMIGGVAVLPDFAPEDAGTDWNDYAAQHGAEAVRAAVLAKLGMGKPAEETGEESAQSENKPTDAKNSIKANIKAVMKWFNDRYMVVNENGRAVIFKIRQDEVLNRRCIDRISFSDLRAFYMNEKLVVHVDENGKETESTAATLWLNSPLRRQYLDGVVFNPNSTADIPGVLNLWGGFDTKPAPGDWSLMREHILHVICGGNQTYFDYLIKWIALMLQRPGQPGEVAVVLRSGEGTGKGLLANALSRIVGQHSVRVTNPEQLVGKFNAHLQDAIFLFADEAFFAGNRGHAGALRGLVTEDRIRIEGKGRDSFEVPSFLHIMMASNEEWVVPSAKDDRRYFVLDVSEHRKGDREYFKAIVNQMTRDGGDAAMLNELLQLDVSDFEVRDFPKTAAARYQKSLSLKTTDAWIKDCLERGYILQSEHGNGEKLHNWFSVATTSLLFSSYEKYAKKHNERHPLPREALGKVLNGMGYKSTRPSGMAITGESKFGVEEQAKKPSYHFGDLATARAIFCTATGLDVEWDGGLPAEQEDAPASAPGAGGPLPWRGNVATLRKG